MCTVTAWQLQFMLLFFPAKRKVPSALCMCNLSFACLCSSAHFPPDTCICVCPSHFVVVLVSKAFEVIGALVYLGSLLMFFSQFLHLPASCSPSTERELIPEVICQLTLYPVLHLYV